MGMILTFDGIPDQNLYRYRYRMVHGLDEGMKALM